MGQEVALLQSITGETRALTGVSAQGKVEGLPFELAVEQRYRNATATNIDAVYAFPLPSAAVLLGLTVRLGERERAGDGLCTMNLGNLMAGETQLRPKLLVDCSGSMGGDSIDAAKRALHSVFGLDRDGGTADVFLITDGEIWAAESLIGAARASRRSGPPGSTRSSCAGRWSDWRAIS